MAILGLLFVFVVLPIVCLFLALTAAGVFTRLTAHRVVKRVVQSTADGQYRRMARAIRQEMEESSDRRYR